ncbi:MAG: sirohydrochlorin chelatase [Cyanobacteria bacterium J06592_8]
MYSTHLLISHGSHDPRPQQALERLVKELKPRISVRLLPSSPSPVLATATLECSPIPLHQQIQQFGEYTQTLGLNQVEILPLFLLPGVHVKEDIPQEVALAQQALGTTVNLKVKPYLGSQLSRLATELMYQITSIPCQAWVLLSHGTRRQNGNQPVEELAGKLGVIPAYLFTPPSLESQLQVLVKMGYQQIGVLPYFIFSGEITDAIARSCTQFSQDFPEVKINLADPLESQPGLVDIVADILLDN